MRVLLAHCFYRSSAPSGEDAVYLIEKELLKSKGIDVISLEKYNDNIDFSTFTNKIKVAINTTWSQSSYKEVDRLLKKYKPDIAHFHNTFPQLSPSVYQACYDNGVPVVQTLHNYRTVCPGAMLLRDGNSCELCLNNSFVPYNSLKYRCYRDSFAATVPLATMIAFNRFKGSFNTCVNRYIALTDFAKDRFIRGGLPANKIVIKPNFLSIDTNKFYKKENYVVFVGRLSEEKGIQTLLQAWHKIVGVKLIILGDGHLREKLEKMSIEQGINVEFLGFCSHDEVIEIVRKALIQVIPSECYEGFPMSVLEAFACSTPVVASRLGSLQEIVIDNYSGMLFEPKSVGDLSEKVNALLVNDEKRIELSLNAKKIFDQKYTDNVNFDVLMRIYNESITDIGNSLTSAESC